MDTVTHGIAGSVLARTLNPSEYTECVVVQGYLQLLRQRQVALDADLEQQRSDLQARFAGPTFASLRMSSNVADVTIGDAGYKLYVQPVQLSLRTLRTDERTGQQVVSGDPEEWVLCGFVRVDRFRAEGAAISYTYLLWFSTALAAICLGIPLVKLRVLGPRERFSAHDGVWVCVTTFAAAGLLTVIAMDVYVFRYD